MMTDDEIRELMLYATKGQSQEQKRAIIACAKNVASAGYAAGQAAAVPREPTDAMTAAAIRQFPIRTVAELDQYDMAFIWRAMYHAALGAGETP